MGKTRDFRFSQSQAGPIKTVTFVSTRTGSKNEKTLKPRTLLKAITIDLGFYSAVTLLDSQKVEDNVNEKFCN